jgi:hypothetical protein
LPRPLRAGHAATLFSVTSTLQPSALTAARDSLPRPWAALLARFGVVPTATAALVSCDAVVRLVVTHGGRVLNAGRGRRVVPGPNQLGFGVAFGPGRCLDALTPRSSGCRRARVGRSDRLGLLDVVDRAHVLAHHVAAHEQRRRRQ